MKLIDLNQDTSARIRRSAASDGPLEAVRAIIAQVAANGDDALRELTARFDGCALDDLRVPQEMIDDAVAGADPALVQALEEMTRRIEAFASHQLIQPWRAEVGGGEVGEIVAPVAVAGAYVPGGRATYPSSVLMTAVPARVAGVGRFIMCVPPAADGKVPAATLVAAHVAGVSEVYRVGGAQAIAAMAFGTQTVPKADVIVGPGNIYVALAKRELAGMVAIDSVAGPSEIAIVADASADPHLVAWDVVAQAEHGPAGAFAVVTWDRALAEKVPGEIEAVLDEVGATQLLRDTVAEGTTIALVDSVKTAAQAIAGFAPEHLELMFDGAEDMVEAFSTAGAVFVGRWSPVSLGDYLAGSNHVLPTGGAATWASGLRASHFQRAVAWVRHDEGSLADASRHIDVMAAAEGLPIHARAVRARFKEQ